jgi:hypothetical protein
MRADMRLALISHERSLPITLYSRDYGLLANIANSLGLCVLGLIVIPRDLWAGLPAFLFFGLCAAVMIHQLRTTALWLRLDYAGFTCGSRVYEYQVPWNRVTEFVIVRSHHKKVVGWRYTGTTAKITPAEAVSIRADATLPDTYGVSPKKLAELMNELRYCHQMTERYLASSRQQA